MLNNEEFLALLKFVFYKKIKEKVWLKFLDLYPQIALRSCYIYSTNYSTHDLNCYCLKCGNIELDIPKEIDDMLSRLYAEELRNYLLNEFLK